jgi:sn-glycerol 3-phosphate transport system permease protein
VAPAVAGVLWLFMFSPRWGVVAYALGKMGINWNHLLNRQPRHGADRDGRGVEADLLQLPVLPGRPAVDPQVADRGRRHRRRRPWRASGPSFPLLSPTTFFLLVINVVYAFFDTFAIVDAATHGGPGKDTAILVYKVYYDGFKAMDLNGSAAQSVVLMVIVVALTVIQFRYVEKKVQY